MRVILARRADSHGGAGPPEVHAYRVPDSPANTTESAVTLREEPGKWVAACGQRAKPDEVEIVYSFTGTPCMTCYMAATLATDTPPIARDELEAAPLPELADATDGAELFALSWRGREVHRVAADALRTDFDGRPLVMGRCGRLGWGPHATVPGGWPVCQECDQITGARA